MSFKGRLARAAAFVERVADRLAGPAPDGPVMVDAHIGHSTPEGLLLKGRVLARRDPAQVRPGQSRLRNVGQMFRLFLTGERAGVSVTARGVRTRTDEEGYFRLTVPRADGESGWIDVAADIAGEPAALPAFAVPDGVAEGVISDIDDTMIETGAYSLLRNLVTTFTGNAATRQAVPGAADLIRTLTGDGRAPVFYVSSSPWNLHGFLRDVFRRHGIPPGPKMLRDLGIDEDKFITGTHGDHKGAAIDAAMAAAPDLRFTLVGDTGQHDAEVYADAVDRHPGRVVRVILREPRPGLADGEAVRRIEVAGIPLHLVPDYRDLLAELGAAS